MAAPLETLTARPGWPRLSPKYCAFAHRDCDCSSRTCPTGGIEVRPSADGPVVHACTCPVCTSEVA